MNNRIIIPDALIKRDIPYVVWNKNSFSFEKAKRDLEIGISSFRKYSTIMYFHRREWEISVIDGIYAIFEEKGYTGNAPFLTKLEFLLPKMKNVMTAKTITAFETFDFNDRTITVAVLYDEFSQKLSAGYSVKVKQDKMDESLAKKIAIGRASKEKTNLLLKAPELPPFYGKQKHILVSIAKNLKKQIEHGKIVIKGIR